MGISLADGRDGNWRLNYGETLMYVTEACTVGNVAGLVADNTTYGYGNAVQQADTGDSAPVDGNLACGRFARTESGAAWTPVQVRGLCTDLNVASTVLAGDSLISSATAGRAQDKDVLFATGSVSQAEGRTACKAVVFGYALTDASSNVSTALLIDPFQLADH